MVKRIAVTILAEEHIRAVAPPLLEIVDIVENTYRFAGNAQTEVPTKIGVHPEWDGSFCHAMPAYVPPARALGMKWISYYPGNFGRGLPDSTGIIILNDPETGQPVAVMEGMWITYARTAACAGVAAKYLAKRPPTTLGLVGCGGLGAWTTDVFLQLFPTITSVSVTSLTAASREAFCARMSGTHRAEFKPVDRAQEAVTGIDIVVSSIPKATTPPLSAEFWSPGTLAIPLDVLSAWDDQAFSREVFLVTDGYEGLQRSAARQRPGLSLRPDYIELSAVVLGRTSVPKDSRVMAIPTGVASVDMTVGWEIFRRAQKAGVGTQVHLT